MKRSAAKSAIAYSYLNYSQPVLLKAARVILYYAVNCLTTTRFVTYSALVIVRAHYKVSIHQNTHKTHPITRSWNDDVIKRNVFRVISLCTGNPLVTGEFPSKRPVTRNFDVFFDLRLNKRLSNNRDDDHLRCHRAHYDVTVMGWDLGCYVLVWSLFQLDNFFALWYSRSFYEILD